MPAWRTAVEAQFAGREALPRAEMHRRFWPELSEGDVLAALEALDVGLGRDFTIGLLRPSDELRTVFTPPSTRNPWRSVTFQLHASDSEFYVATELARRLADLGIRADWEDKIRTLDDLVRAWSGKL